MRPPGTVISGGEKGTTVTDRRFLFLVGLLALIVVVGAVALVLARGDRVPPPQPLVFDVPVQGNLSAGDSHLRDRELADVYTFAAEAGQVISLLMTSGAFDPYLILRGPDGSQVENDDLTAGDHNSSGLEMTLTVPGEYTVYATSYAAERVGSYTLVLRGSPSAGAAAEESESGPIEQTAAAVGAAAEAAGEAVVQALPDSPGPPPAPEKAGPMQIAVGQTVAGSLTSTDPRRETGQPHDEWSVEGQAGQTIAVTMQSAELDTYLIVVHPNMVRTENDDIVAGQNTNSQIVLTLPIAGEYRLLTSCYAPGETGDYTLSVH
jgi:hypothetical protein